MILLSSPFHAGTQYECSAQPFSTFLPPMNSSSCSTFIDPRKSRLCCALGLGTTLGGEQLLETEIAWNIGLSLIRECLCSWASPVNLCLLALPMLIFNSSVKYWDTTTLFPLIRNFSWFFSLISPQTAGWLGHFSGLLFSCIF